MDLNAKMDINCGWKDGWMDGLTENQTPISHLAKAGVTKISSLRQTVQKLEKCQE